MGAPTGDFSQCVTDHAITRYVQRVLGITLPGADRLTRQESARQHCLAAGLAAAQVVSLILATPRLIDGLRAGAASVRSGSFIFAMQSGHVTTVLEAEMRYPRLREPSTTEGRRKLRRVRGRRFA